MRAAHEPIVRLARSALVARGSGMTVLDLGCGNGRLLHEIVRATGAVPFGIEVDAERARRANERLREFGGAVVAGDLFTSTTIWSRRYDLVILTASALLEIPAAFRHAFTARLAAGARTLLVYTYDDDDLKFGSLDVIAKQSGLQLRGARLERAASLAALGQPAAA